MKKYNIGIDLGTNSSGIAVVGEDLKLIKHKNKNLWSVMKFDSGETAAKRRVYRGARRLNTRRKNRIKNLGMLLEAEINKIDNSFFQRLEDSFKHLEDRVNKDDSYNLFIDRDFNDKHYYTDYPTIYHLRKELLESDEKKDIRLIYLALHHILKYRGNFLYEGQSLESVSAEVDTIIIDLEKKIEEHFQVNLNLNIDEVLKIIDDKSKSRKDKVKEIVALNEYNKFDKTFIEQVFKGLLGMKIDLTKIDSEVDFGEIDKLEMSSDVIEEKISDLSYILGEKIEVFEIMQKAYVKIKLNDILNNQEYISQAMFLKYEKFNYDLRILKEVIKDNCDRKIYNELFKEVIEDIEDKKGKKETEKDKRKKEEAKEKLVSYEKYINSKIKVSGKDKSIEKQRDVFYEKIKSILKDIDNEETKYILNQIENKEFLIKINVTSNSVIPYQVHLKELKKILENQKKYYEVLEMNKEKIESILTFRIPYYVGPLSKTKTEFSWMIRNEGMEEEKIYPWNFEEVVNRDKSAEEFITRMTSYCSYLPNESVLPFNSILYTEYLYYTEINKVRFNGKLLDKLEKEDLKSEIFMNQNGVTEKNLIAWYSRKNSIFTKENITVTGFMGDGKVNATLKPIRDFKRIYGKITNENINEIERIIYYLTVFEDKKIVKRKLDKEFNLTEHAKKEILQLNYKGWGKYSRELLQNLTVVKADCTKVNIIDELKYSNLNFMQIINSNELGFNKKIDSINGSDKIDKINYEKHIKTLQGSPALKKAIYQATKQIEEVIKVTGTYPEKIFVEVAKEDQESKRTLTRNKKMLELYEEIKDKNDSDKDTIKNLKNKDFKVDTEKKYLYIIQRGKCMYSGKSLDFSSLHEYEVDHIIPRAIIKNDSLSNKALVLKSANQKKSSGALDDDIVKNMKRYWQSLLDYKLITKSKFDNLINNNLVFTDKEEKNFINRQLVEVRQITKHVVNLLNRAYGQYGTKVYAIKAELVDDFKNQFKVYKNRNINDFHHAKDAYATAVVGSYITKRFSNLESEFIYDDYKEYSKKDTRKNKFGFIISSMLYDYTNEDGEVVWDAENEIKNFKKIFKYNDIFVVKKTEIISGQMFNLTRYKAPKDGALKEEKIPLRNNKELYLEPEKYGYYEGIQESYYSIVEFTNKKKRVLRIVGVPIMFAKEFKNNIDKQRDYFESKGYKDVSIIKAIVPKYQKIIYEGNEYYLTSSKEWQNAKQLKLKQEYYDLISILSNDKKKLQYKKEINTDDISEVLDEIIDMLLNKIEINYSMYNSIINKIKDKTEMVKRLEEENKIKLINELLKLTAANSSCANLKLIGENDRVGRIRAKENADVNKMVFIYESHLGVVSREVRYKK